MTLTDAEIDAIEQRMVDWPVEFHVHEWRSGEGQLSGCWPQARTEAHWHEWVASGWPYGAQTREEFLSFQDCVAEPFPLEDAAWMLTRVPALIAALREARAALTGMPIPALQSHENRPPAANPSPDTPDT